MAKQPPKSLSKKGLRPLAASRTILSVPVLVVPKEHAACQFAVLARPLGPDARPEIPGKAKRSTLRQLAVSPNSRAEPYIYWGGCPGDVSLNRTVAPTAK